MSLSLGIIGLPNSGKSSLFNALCGATSPTAPYPFTTIDPFYGATPVPDERLQALKKILNPPITTPAVMKFIDIAGLVRGAHKGEGLGNLFLSHIRGVDAQCHIVRFFENPDIPHPYNSVDPVRDAEIVMMEIVLSDIEIVERRLGREVKARKACEGDTMDRVSYLEEILDLLKEGRINELRSLISCRKDEMKRTKSHPIELPLISAKPVIYVANLSDEQWESRDEVVKTFSDWALEQGSGVVPIPVRLEEELIEVQEDERDELRRELGLEGLGIQDLIRQGIKLLSLITFYTTVGDELRAWNITGGCRAIEAAGMIHTDMKKGFIKAEVISFEDFIGFGGEKGAREKGAVRIEGKDYVVQDGDIIHFRFR